MKKSIPDLRDDTDYITLDHVYVLIESLGRTLDQMEGTEGLFAQAADELNPVVLRSFLQSYFEPKTFTRLFKTETGKGVLAGFIIKFILDSEERQTEDETEYY